jgi:hypothetical protein
MVGWRGDVERFGRAGELPYKRVMENMPIPEGIETWRDGEAVMFRWSLREVFRHLNVWTIMYVPCILGWAVWDRWNVKPHPRDTILEFGFWLAYTAFMAYFFLATRVDWLTVAISPDGVRCTAGPLPWFRDRGVRAGEILGVVTRSQTVSKGRYVYHLMYIDRDNRERRLLSQIGMWEHAEMVAKSIGMVLRIPERTSIGRSAPSGMKVRESGGITTIIPSRKMRRLRAMPLLGIAVALVVVWSGNTAVWLILGAVLLFIAGWLFVETQETRISPSGVKRVSMPVSFGRSVEIAAPEIHSLATKEKTDSFLPGIVYEVACFDRSNKRRILAMCDTRDEAEYIEESIREIVELPTEVLEAGTAV